MIIASIDGIVTQRLVPVDQGRRRIRVTVVRSDRKAIISPLIGKLGAACGLPGANKTATAWLVWPLMLVSLQRRWKISLDPESRKPLDSDDLIPMDSSGLARLLH